VRVDVPGAGASFFFDDECGSHGEPSSVVASMTPRSSKGAILAPSK